MNLDPDNSPPIPDDARRSLMPAANNGSNGHIMRAPIVHAPSSGPDAWSLLRAIGRRWLLALLLGSLVGACAGAAAWRIIPTPYQSFAMLRILVNKPALLYRSEDTSFDMYRSNQVGLIRSTIVLNNALNRPEVASLPRILSDPDPVDTLLRELNISFPGGELMRISITGEQPTELAAMVNAVVDAYMSEVADSEQSTRLKRIGDLEKLLAQSEQTVQTKRTTFRSVAERVGAAETATAAARHQVMLQMFMSHQTELSRIEFQRMRAEVKLKTAKIKAESRQFEVPEKIVEELIEVDASVRSLQASIARLEQRKAEYARVARKKDDRNLIRFDDEIAAAQATLEDRRQELRPKFEERLSEYSERNAKLELAQLEIEIESLKDQAKDLRAECDKQRTEIDLMGQDSVELDFLKKEMDHAEGVYNRAIGELTTMRVEIQAPPRAMVLTRATPPRTRDTGKRQKGTMLASAGGFVLAVLLVGMLEWRARRITSPLDVVREVGLRVVGTVPALPSAKRVSPTQNGQMSTRARRWYRVFEESFDVLRATLLYGTDGPAPRSLMVTSAHGREGKTTLSAHISASLARAGRRTLLIDCDFRRPSIHTLFDVERKPGFADVVEGRVQLSDAIQPTVIPNLFLLTAGTANHQISKLTADEQFGKLLKRMCQEWDNVVVDAPPILPVSDGLIAGQYVDGVVLTALSGVTGALALQDAQDRLQGVGVNILGLVLMGFEPSSYYGYYVSKYYRRYAEHYANSPPPEDKPVRS